jgi:hypothetical protein
MALQEDRPVLIGALVGGGSIFLVQLTIMCLQGKVYCVPLIALTGLGALTGAIWGIAVAFFGETGCIIGPILGGIPACFVIVLILTWYAIMPWAAPRPYPGSDVEMSGGTGAWGQFRNQKYVVSLSLNDVEQYYRKQMSKYCEGAWEFVAPEDCSDYSSCRSARCEIRRFAAEQRFTVDLYAISEKETKVSQWDAWQD